MTLSTEGTPVGDLVAVVGIVPCSVVTTDGSVIRADHGGTSLLLEVGPDRRGGRSRHTAIVANVGPHDSPVTRVEIEGRAVSSSRTWVRSRSVSLLAGAAASVVAVTAGTMVRSWTEQPAATAAALAGESPVTDDLESSPAATSVVDPVGGVAPSLVPVPTTTSVAPAASPATEDLLLAEVTGDSRNWLLIPRLDLASPIVRGTDDADLGRGVGRYTMTARIGSAGNLGLAGHRTTPPAPFRHLDTMEIGDVILVVTPDETLRYEVEPAAPGRAHIEVTPDAVEVLDSRGHDGLTLTTCTPVGTTERRLIVFARLVSRTPR